MKARTLKEFYVEYRSVPNPITGEPKLFKDMTDEMVWNAAFDAGKKEAQPAPNTRYPNLCSFWVKDAECAFHKGHTHCRETACESTRTVSDS